MKEEKKLSWGDVMWIWIKRGYPREEAIFQADEFMKRREKERFTESKKRLALIGKKSQP